MITMINAYWCRIGPSAPASSLRCLPDCCGVHIAEQLRPRTRSRGPVALAARASASEMYRGVCSRIGCGRPRDRLASIAARELPDGLGRDCVRAPRNMVGWLHRVSWSGTQDAGLGGLMGRVL